jgi:hypothetical protein
LFADFYPDLGSFKSINPNPLEEGKWGRLHMGLVNLHYKPGSEIVRKGMS